MNNHGRHLASTSQTRHTTTNRQPSRHHHSSDNHSTTSNNQANAPNTSRLSNSMANLLRNLHGRSYAQVVSSPPPARRLNHPTRDNTRPRSMTSSPNAPGRAQAKRQKLKHYEPFKPLSPNALHTFMKTLTFPPSKTDPAWASRCFDCLVVGHRPGACASYMVCRNCLRSRHKAKDFRGTYS